MHGNALFKCNHWDFLIETNFLLPREAALIVGVIFFPITDVPKCLLLTTPSLSLVSQVLHPQLQFQQTISFTHVRKIYVTAC